MLTRRARSFLGSTRNPLWAALTLSALAIVAIGSPALVGAATGVGARLELGKVNSVNATTSLTATTTGSAFALKNLGTGGGLNITVKTGKSPITVSAGAGKATNLDADKLDGKDGSEYQLLVDDIRDLNGIGCTNGFSDGLLLALAAGVCVVEIDEPNNDVGNASTVDENQKIYALAGNGDADWVVVGYPAHSCGNHECLLTGNLWGQGAKLDFYIDDKGDGTNPVKVLTGVTSFSLTDTWAGDVWPLYLVRIYAPSRVPYAFTWH